MNQTSRRRLRGQRPGRPRLSAAVCLCLLVLQVSPACAFQQRPRTTAAPPPAPPTASSTTGAGPWGDQVADLARFPSEEVAFIAGPQLKSGSASNPAPWFDRNASEKGVQHGEAFPAEPPFRALTGTVTTAAGSKTVTGSGTKFLAELRPGNEDYFIIRGPQGGRFVRLVSTIESDTSLTLNLPVEPGAVGARLAIGKMTADEGIAFENANYYDQAQVQYINCYRTGDQRFCAYARKIADSWWKSGPINEGRTHVEESIAPRSIGLGGLMLRALDGRPEMWPWITEFTRTQFQLWVERPLGWFRALSDAQIAGTAPRQEGGQTVTKKAGFYFGVRDGGYMLLHAANLAAVHPDRAVRADLKARVLAAAVEYYARVQRLQYDDGGFYFEIDASAPGPLTTQPFQEGILGEGLVAVHRLTGDERVKASIVKLAEHLYLKAFNANGWRAPYYFVRGSFANGHSCEKGCGAAANPFPPSERGQIAEARQLAPTQAHVFGYAFYLTEDPKFIRWGDDLFDAAFSGRDGHRALCDFRQKEYGECYRSSGKYLAWRLAHGNVPPGGSPAAPGPAAAPAGAAATRDDTGPAATAQAPAGAAAAETEGPRGLVAAALAEALRQASGGEPSEAQLRALLTQVEAARDAFAGVQEKFLAPAEALTEMEAAREHLQNALRMVTTSNGSGEEAKLRVGWAAARLKRAGERIRGRGEP